ncbi:MAG: hypothetical protein ACI8RD_010537 [Bacillariaceae sp.]|jgi:hypothetical protein
MSGLVSDIVVVVVFVFQELSKQIENLWVCRKIARFLMDVRKMNAF